ncbi:hypothetical protein U1Q18_008250, partial [Sarracenia purpurea var. burkii]
MSEEHGYQRTGKKCREKFENLYKYYKKTKEGKAGRQDGKHYRFFRQLEALYGDTTGHPVSVSETHQVGNSFRFHNTTNFTAHANQESFQAPKLCDSLSLSNSSEYGTSSSDINDDANATRIMDDDSTEKKKIRRGRRTWKVKIRDFIDSQMRKLMEKQQEWFEKMMKTLERKEEERMMRDEEWRKQETDRVEREHQFWAKERAWIEARDAALMESLRKIREKEGKASSSSPGEIQTHCENPNENALKLDSWPECEITNLIHLRSSMESRFQQSGCSEEVLWEMEKKKKKLKDNSRSCSYIQNNESVYNQGGTYSEIGGNDSCSPLPLNAAATTGSAMNDSCFRFLVGTDHGENLWESYGVRMGKRDNQSS